MATLYCWRCGRDTYVERDDDTSVVLCSTCEFDQMQTNVIGGLTSQSLGKSGPKIDLPELDEEDFMDDYEMWQKGLI